MTAEAAVPTVPSERYGPLVHRSVRHGAILYIVAVVQFLVGMAVTQLLYGPPTYNLLSNYISDLGAIHCGPLAGRQVCSPGHEVFNVSIIILGILLILGTLLIRTSFPARSTRSVGLG